MGPRARSRSGAHDRGAARACVALAVLVAAAACSGTDAPDRTPADRGTDRATTSTPTTTAAPLPPGVTPPPDWLGTRPLPQGPEGVGAVRPTPPELQDRRFTTGSHLPPPTAQEWSPTVGPVPPDVAARSTWSPECPVGLDDLRYVTVAFRGFDGAAHTGELLVHHDVADGVVDVFERLYEAAFPIEEMRVVRMDELDAPPTGDGNNTTAFVCRPIALGTTWSQHALGRAIDVNPFHNPYVRGDVVLPELASAYTDRSRERPGMILAGDVVTRSFAAIGWSWGGEFATLTDPMHFSADGG